MQGDYTSKNVLCQRTEPHLVKSLPPLHQPLNIMKIKTQEQFIQRLGELYKSNVAISKAKNSDYAGKDDPFANFKACETFGVTAATGIIVRMTDKLSRASNLISRQAAVKDESILDTLSDLANYAMILRMFLETNDSR